MLGVLIEDLLVIPPGLESISRSVLAIVWNSELKWPGPRAWRQGERPLEELDLHVEQDDPTSIDSSIIAVVNDKLALTPSFELDADAFDIDLLCGVEHHVACNSIARAA